MFFDYAGLSNCKEILQQKYKVTSGILKKEKMIRNSLINKKIPCWENFESLYIKYQENGEF